MGLLKKIIITLVNEVRTRGFFITLTMQVSQLLAFFRGHINKLIYFRNIKSTFFSLQSGSRIEIFNKKAKVTIGKFVFIRKNVSLRIDFDGELIIREKVFINDNCTINCVNKVTIGSQTKIAPNVCINDHDHNYKHSGEDHLVRGEVHIGKNVWIGSNVVILKDTYIGDNSVIAAGSVVKGHIPSNTLFFNKRSKQFIDLNPAEDVRDIL
jgi:acetyltransferase-like isoleucine patch superfamily enzyme